MNAMVPHRGGAPVGYVTELGPVEAGAVLYLRLWCDGPDGQAQVSKDFATALGKEGGQKVLQSFGCLCDMCVRHGRRPLMRHHVTCKCLGADESCFANFIGYASDGEREDAHLIATTIVRPDMAPALVGLPQDFGFALKRMAIKANRPIAKPKTLHSEGQESMNPLTLAASVLAHGLSTVDTAEGYATKAAVLDTCADTLWHGGGGQSQRDEVIDMSLEDRGALIRPLERL